MSGGAVSGIAAGSVVALVVVGMLIWFFRRRRSIRSSSGYIYDTVDPEIDEIAYNLQPFSTVSPPNTASASHPDTPPIDPTRNDYSILPVPFSSLQQRSVRPEKGRPPILSQLGGHNRTPSSNAATSQTSTAELTFSSSPIISDTFTEHHSDAGPLLLLRSTSGRLPPAYGQQL